MKETSEEQLERYKTTVRDVRYILGQYSESAPKEAWETIKKLVWDKKLKLAKEKI